MPYARLSVCTMLALLAPPFANLCAGLGCLSYVLCPAEFPAPRTPWNFGLDMRWACMVWEMQRGAWDIVKVCMCVCAPARDKTRQVDRRQDMDPGYTYRIVSYMYIHVHYGVECSTYLHSHAFAATAYLSVSVSPCASAYASPPPRRHLGFLRWTA